MVEPYETELNNPGRDDNWSCPGCYHDLGDVGEGVHQCPSCGRQVKCTLEHQPVRHSTLNLEDEDE